MRLSMVQGMPAVEYGLIALLRQCYHAPGCRMRPQLLAAAQTKRRFQTSNGRPSRRIGRDGSSQTKFIKSHDRQDCRNKHIRAQSTTSTQPKNIAILGGGVTGLASAIYLMKELPHANITIYEGGDRLGGWMRSTHIDVENGSVVFEHGPRTLRPKPPAGLVTLELIKMLGLEDELIITSKRSVAAQNRYVYFPDRLVRMPGPGAGFFENLWSILTEPVFKGLLRATKERNIPKRPDSMEDESVGHFLTRRLDNSAIPDNLVSAVLHGIYAGDVYKLSAKSLLPALWRDEAQDGSFLRATWNRMKRYAKAGRPSKLMEYRDATLYQEMTTNPVFDTPKFKAIGGASVYAFRKGISQFSEALVTRLRESQKVDIKTSTMIEKIEYDENSNQIVLSTNTKEPPQKYDQVISTLFSRKLSELVSTNTPLPSLVKTSAVTVMVVNLWYKEANLIDERGFGYLIPRTIPYEQNPEQALGVIFDSDGAIGQDSAGGTKLTVMLGGHWWDGFSSYPDEEQGEAMAKAVLKRHLKIDVEPDVVRVAIHKDCIPQYTVGHDARMKAAHSELLSAFKGKLTVAGNSYTGVGVNDCVRAARAVALDVAQYEGPLGITGLEQFEFERKWIYVNFDIKPK